MNDWPVDRPESSTLVRSHQEDVEEEGFDDQYRLTRQTSMKKEQCALEEP